MSDLSRRLARIEQKAAPEGPAIILIWGDEPEPPNPTGAQIVRIRWQGVDDEPTTEPAHG